MLTSLYATCWSTSKTFSDLILARTLSPPQKQWTGQLQKKQHEECNHAKHFHIIHIYWESWITQGIDSTIGIWCNQQDHRR